MHNNQLWYTRRNREIRGPFPAGQITRDILLGRILQTDELSVDQISWQPVTDLPELIPEELKADLTVFENKERLRIARFREDERQLGDRRKQNQNDGEDEFEKRGPDRRSSEPLDAIRHRELKTKYLNELRERKDSAHVSSVLLLVLVFTAAIWFATVFIPI